MKGKPDIEGIINIIYPEKGQLVMGSPGLVKDTAIGEFEGMVINGIINKLGGIGCLLRVNTLHAGQAAEDIDASMMKINLHITHLLNFPEIFILIYNSPFFIKFLFSTH